MEGVKKMQNSEKMLMAATNCSEYDPIVVGLSASIGDLYGVSCENCHHWRNARCDIDLYDEILNNVEEE